MHTLHETLYEILISFLFAFACDAIHVMASCQVYDSRTGLGCCLGLTEIFKRPYM